MAEFLVELGIDSMSLNPDSVLKTTLHVLEVEKRLGRAPRGRAWSSRRRAMPKPPFAERASSGASNRPADGFELDVSRRVWEARYRHRRSDGTLESSISESWQRVARAIAAAEPHPARWERRFLELLDGFRFLPGGRILAGPEPAGG